MITTIPLYIGLSSRIDTMRALTDSALSIQQAQSIQLDTLGGLSKQLVEGQIVFQKQLGTLYEQVQTISEYGIGFSDVATHIAIPLIIALFAFAFPFLFTVISHINNKFESENISKQFFSEPSYKWYMRGAAISAGYLIAVGAISLILKGPAYHLYMSILNWSSVAVASGYSAIIVLFVHTCLEYNNPQRLVEKADNQLKRRRKSRIRYLFWLDSATELCKYAIKKQNYSLFQSLIQRVAEESGYHKNEDNYRCLFYEDVLESNLYGPQNQKLEDTLLMYWFLALRRDRIPNLGIMGRMLEKVISAVDKGNMNLFEGYLVKARNGYRYINDVPSVAYVCGKDGDAQKKIEEERRRCWRELIEMHYLAMARLFASGNYDVLRVIMSGDNLGYDRLFPGSGLEVLRFYARCKENQLVDGGYTYWFRDGIIGKNPDHDLLEKFTAIMLLLAPEEGLEVFHFISVKHLNLIKSGKERIEYYANLWKGNKVICDLFPQIAGINIRPRFQKVIKRFEKACVSQLLTEVVPQYLVNALEDGFYNVLYANEGYIMDRVNAGDSSDKTELIEMGGYTYQLYKLPFMEEGEVDISDYCWDEAQKFRSRYQYMVYSALSKMKITDVSMPVKDFESYFVKHYGMHGNDYMIIDSDSLMHLFCEFDKNPQNTTSLLHRQYKGADHRLYDLSIGWYLRDIPELEPFKKTVVIIRKEDLPYVFSTCTDSRPSVTLVDESDKEKGEAIMRITVNPNLALKYSREAKVVRVMLTQNR